MYVDDTIISPAARPRSAPEGRPPVPQRADNHAPPLASVNGAANQRGSARLPARVERRKLRVMAVVAVAVDKRGKWE